jgi:adenylate cyclase
MAVFGAPLDDLDHALHAAQTALAMDRALAAFNRAWTAGDRAPLRMDIAIHTGEVFAGNVGKDRIK